MKYILSLLIAIGLLSFIPSSKGKKGLHKFTVTDINGGKIDFSKYKGKKVLIVNVASKCGFTKQYTALQDVYTKYSDKLVIVGFPCNQFGEQEKGTAEEIQTFCKANYGVTFPLASKVEVKGDNIAPIYKWLTNKSENGVLDATIGWNFGKFLVDEKGNLLKYFPSATTPDSKEILSYLK